MVVQGGVLHGESPPRIRWLKEFLAQAPPFDELRPLGDDRGCFLLAKPSEYYLRSARWLGRETGHSAVMAYVVQVSFAPEAAVPNRLSSYD